jgi:hypothetical protein
MPRIVTPDTEWIAKWLRSMRWTRRQSANALGIHYNTFCNYAAGCRSDGDASPLPQNIKLAMTALKMLSENDG